MKITNLAPNQTIVSTETTTIFSSYGTNIVKIEEGVTSLDEKFYKFSTTTAKWRNSFLGLTSKEVENNIKTGKFVLTNLN